MEVRQQFLGMSRWDVEESKKKHEASFDINADLCFENIIKILRTMGALIPHQDKEHYFIEAYRFNEAFKPCIDTTEVGILMKPEAENKTRVIIVSDNYYLADFVSKEIFKKLKEKKE